MLSMEEMHGAKERSPYEGSGGELYAEISLNGKGLRVLRENLYGNQTRKI